MIRPGSEFDSLLAGYCQTNLQNQRQKPGNKDDNPSFHGLTFLVNQASAHKVSSSWMTYVFFLVLAICSLQALKGIDFAGYIGTIASARSVGLETPPYPKDIAKHGDYFQSPIKGRKNTNNFSLIKHFEEPLMNHYSCGK